jgi:hypothetical protein
MEIIKFPYVHKDKITIHSIKECLEDFNDNMEVESFSIVINIKNKIMTCYDGKSAIKTIGMLEVLKQNIIEKMNEDL